MALITSRGGSRGETFGELEEGAEQLDLNVVFFERRWQGKVASIFARSANRTTLSKQIANFCACVVDFSGNLN